MTEKGGRLPLAVGVNFAQRVDLVRELLEGRAEEAQTARSAKWQEGIKQFASSQDVFTDLLPAEFERLQRQWLEANSLSRIVFHEEHPLTLAAADENGHHLARVSLVDLPVGPYAFVAVPKKAQDVDLYMFRGGQSDVVGQDEDESVFALVGLTLNDPLSLDATVAGPEEGLEVTLHVIRGE